VISENQPVVFAKQSIVFINSVKNKAITGNNRFKGEKG